MFLISSKDIMHLLDHALKKKDIILYSPQRFSNLFGLNEA